MWIGHNPNNAVGRDLEIPMKKGKLVYLGPDFPIYYSRQSSFTPDIILANNKTSHNLIENPGLLIESDHTPIIFMLTNKAVTNPTPKCLEYNKANWMTFKEAVQRGL